MTASVTPPPPSSAPTAPVAVGAGPAAGDPQSNSQTGAQTGSQPDAQTNTAPRSEPVPQPRGPAAILPALQAFGAALHRAVVAERRQVLHDGDAIPILSAPISSAFATPAVASSTAPLDTAQPRWPEAMVTRIEQLRDLATVPGSSADTRIRLLPDALGPVEIVLRRDGDAVHVQLTAADQATRTLLADAQPRLVELAETKGLRLAMQADGGPAGQGDRRPPAPAPTQPPRPASVRTDADADSADPHLRLA
jgi:flagellar hook-length control protein FliK